MYNPRFSKINGVTLINKKNQTLKMFTPTPPHMCSCTLSVQISFNFSQRSLTTNDLKYGDSNLLNQG